MKFCIFAILLVVASACALPQQEVEVTNERMIEGAILNAIDRAMRWIRNSGLDPLDIVSRDVNYIIIPGSVELIAFINDVHFSGASNIVVNSIHFNVFTNRLSMDLGLPKLTLSIGNIIFQSTLFDRIVDGELSGTLDISGIRLAGDAIVTIGIGGIGVHGINVDFTVAKFEAALTAIGQEDYSDYVNDLINVRIPAALITNKNEINRIIGDIIIIIVEWW